MVEAWLVGAGVAIVMVVAVVVLGLVGNDGNKGDGGMMIEFIVFGIIIAGAYFAGMFYLDGSAPDVREDSSQGFLETLDGPVTIPESPDDQILHG